MSAQNPTPTLPHAFVGKDKSLDMLEAYSWNRDEIIKWLSEVAGDPVAWGAKEQVDSGGSTLEIKPMLQELAVWIKYLSLPDGEGYEAADLRPSQHISRRRNAGWSAKNVTSSKFSVQGFVSRDGIHLFNQYDMLGRFLGLLGPANPSQVTKYNFYLPMTAMYAQWCSELGTKTWPGREIFAALPAMFQCTWDKNSGWYRLGASLGGHVTAATGTWLEVIRNARYAVLVQSRSNRIHFNVQRGEEPVEKGKEDKEPTPWGNCAETYPFIEMFWGDKYYNKECIRGLALNRSFLLDPDAARMASEAGTKKFYDDAFEGCVYKHQDGPCINCRKLINKAVKPTYPKFGNYGKALDKDEFPDRRAERAIAQKKREETEAAKAEVARMEKEQQEKLAADKKKNAWTKQ